MRGNIKGRCAEEERRAGGDVAVYSAESPILLLLLFVKAYCQYFPRGSYSIGVTKATY